MSKDCPCCKQQVPPHCSNCGYNLEKAIDDLVPCKLCQGNARFVVVQGNKMYTTCTKTFYVQCVGCKTRTKDYDNDVYSHEDAIKDWNAIHG